MAMRLGDYLVRGELINLRRNSTYGTLELAGLESLVRFELTGNCAPDLYGKHIRFEPVTRPDPGSNISRISWHLIGPVGDITAADWVKTFDCPVEEYVRRSKLGEAPPTYWARRFYFEFYCQHGRVVIELAGAKLEYNAGNLDEEIWLPMPETTPMPTEEDEQRMNELAREQGPDITILHASGEIEKYDPERSTDTPEDKAADAFQKELDNRAAEIDRALFNEPDDENTDNTNRILAEFNLIEKIFESAEDEPLNQAFEKQQLPPDDQMSDREIEIINASLLVQMAMACTALHVCEHYTSRDTYRLMREKIFTEWKFYPGLKNMNFTQNYMTSDYCAQCDAENEAEYNRRNP